MYLNKISNKKADANYYTNNYAKQTYYYLTSNKYSIFHFY